MHTACAAYAAKIQIDRGLKGTRRTLLCVTAAIYIATFVSWVALLVSQFRSLSTIKNDLVETSPWIPPSDCFVQRSVEDLPAYCIALPAARASVSDAWDSAQGCVGTGALTFNVVLGDAIVWWRVWVLWNRNRLVLASSCFVLFATLVVFGALDSAVSCSGGLLDDPLSRVSNDVAAGGAFFEGNFFGLFAIGVSLFSNIAATLLVGYKAWKHRLRAKRHFAQVTTVTRTQHVLMLLVESGVAYCLLWALVLSSNASWIISSPGLSAWSNGMLYFTEGCIVALVGIYPTLIIVLVALDRSEIERHSLAWSIPVAHAAQPSDSERDIRDMPPPSVVPPAPPVERTCVRRPDGRYPPLRQKSNGRDGAQRGGTGAAYCHYLYRHLV
ncbi:hypothetical protein LXA43DRAFT_719244 [Ganoderma leucocontextum]|nr:hypothetical protein LXA43DRAFT_719244 [Ganoderma leucocontextum]